MKPGRGAFLISLAIAVFSVTSGLVKLLPEVPAGQIVFMRSVGSLPILIIWLWMRGELRTGLKTNNPLGHAYRAIAGTLSMGLGFTGLKLLPLPEVTALSFIMPILVIILAAIFLGERIRLARISAVLLGLIGVLVILWPRLSMETGGSGQRELIGALIVLASAGFAASAQIFIKRMVGIESTAAIVFYFSLTSMVLALFSAPFGWVWPSAYEIFIMLAIGILGGFGQIFLTSSYRFADASMLAPFIYQSMLWALFIGFVFFDEIPSLMMLSGAALVILSGVLILLRERALARRFSQAAPNEL